MHPEQIICTVHSEEVYCEGESPATGHPRVFLTMGDLNEVTCPYCSKKFVLEAK